MAAGSNPFAEIGANLPSARAAGSPAAVGGGASNPFAAIGAAPGTPAVAANPNSEVQSVGNANAKYLGMIGRSGNTQAAQSAAAVANHNSGGGLFHDVLSALDIPRSAVVSGLDTAWKAGPAAFAGGLPSVLGLIGGDSKARQQFTQGVANHETFGHILHSDLGIQNHAVDSIGGMVGDVATDPLTYVGGLGEGAKAMGVAGHVADAVNAASKASDAATAADEAVRGGESAAEIARLNEAATSAAKDAAEKTAGGVINADTMARLQTKGIAGLNNEERTALSQMIGKGDIKTGIGIRVPGTKLAGSPKALTLVPGALTDPISGAVKQFTSKLADTKVVTALEKNLVPHAALKSAMRGAALAGDGAKAAGIKAVLDLAPKASGVARSVMKEYGPRFADALNGIPGEALGHVAAAMEGSPEAADAVGRLGGGEGLGKLQSAYKDIHDAATAKGMKLGTIENYFPHQLTAEARDIFAKHGNSTRAGGQFANAVQRQFVPGTTYLGHEITDPREGGASIIDQINKATHDVYGQDAWDLFKSDPRDVTANYLRGIAYSMGHQHFLNELEARGLTASGEEAKTPEAWQALAHGDTVAPPYIKEALAKLAEEQAGGRASPSLLRYYDKALNSWKAFSLAMPGKAMRHTIASPLWGSYLGNVGPTSLRQGFGAYRGFQKALKGAGGDLEGALKQVPKAHQDQIRQAVEHGLFHGHEFNVRDITGPQTKVEKVNAKIHNPLSVNSAYMRKNVELQREGQDYWRYAMFHDAMKKGATAEGAAAKVRTMLGDPHSITNAERQTLRRVVPFYTFLRQNAPVELSNLARQPGKFVNAIQAPGQEISQWSPGQGIVPQMFKQTGAIPLPWKIGGNQVYVSPDLPFSRFDEMLSGWNQVESQMSPLIQAGVEEANNVNTFTGTPFSPYGKQMPGADVPAVLGPILHAIDPSGVYKTTAPSTDYGVTTPAGQWQITPKASTLLGNFFPPLTQAQGLITAGSPNKATRGDTSLIDGLVGGLTFRTDDPSQQAGELLRRQAALKKTIEDLQNKGQLPKYIPGFKP